MPESRIRTSSPTLSEPCAEYPRIFLEHLKGGLHPQPSSYKLESSQWATVRLRSPHPPPLHDEKNKADAVLWLSSISLNSVFDSPPHLGWPSLGFLLFLFLFLLLTLNAIFGWELMIMSSGFVDIKFITDKMRYVMCMNVDRCTVLLQRIDDVMLILKTKCRLELVKI